MEQIHDQVTETTTKSFTTALTELNNLFCEQYILSNPSLIETYMKVYSDNYYRLLSMKFHEELIANVAEQFVTAASRFNKLSKVEISQLIEESGEKLANCIAAKQINKPLKKK